MAFVSITRLRIRSWRYTPTFAIEAIRSALQARQSKDNYNVLLLRDVQNTYWTCTVWSDEAAMRKFMMAGAHRKVMPKLTEWCDEASITHWQQDELILPPWSDIHRRMQTEGRTTKLKHPSKDHLAYKIPSPVVRIFNQIYFKKP